MLCVFFSKSSSSSPLKKKCKKKRSSSSKKKGFEDERRRKKRRKKKKAKEEEKDDDEENLTKKDRRREKEKMPSSSSPKGGGGTRRRTKRAREHSPPALGTTTIQTTTKKKKKKKRKSNDDDDVNDDEKEEEEEEEADSTKKAAALSLTVVVPKIREEEDGKRRRTKGGGGSSLCAPIVVLEGHEGAVNDVQFSTDGTVIGTGGNDRCVRLWSYDIVFEEGTLTTKTTTETTQKEKNSIENVAILRGHKNAVLSLAFLSDQFTIASASADKSVRVWDVEYGEQVKKYEKNHARAINCVDANERGASLIVSASDDGYSKVFDVRVAKKEVMKLKHKFPVVSCAMRQDGMECATSGVDGIVRTWDLRNATRYHDAPKEEDRERLAKEDLLNLDTKMTTLTMKNGHADIVTGLAYTCPDGFEVASVGMDGKCNLFDVKPFRENGDSRVEKTYKGVQTDFEKRIIKCATSSPLLSSNVSSKPTYVSSGSACGNVFVWDQKSGKIKYKLPGHKGSCLSVAFHPFEPVLASSGADGKVFLGELAL